MKRALVVGSLNMDVILRTNKLPHKGETKIAKEWKIAGGGKGANQAIAMGRLGANVVMVGKVGNDEFGRKLIEDLETSNVNTDGILMDEHEKTGMAYITIDDTGENTIVVAPGANSKLSIKDIEEREAILLDSDILVLQMEIPEGTNSYVIDLAKKVGKQVVLNFAPAVELNDETLGKVDFLILNETEAAYLAGVNRTGEQCIETIDRTVELIRKKFLGDILITLGNNGCIWADKKGNISRFIAFPVEAVDSTGSGDAFVGGFVYGLLMGKSMSDSIRLANAAGALAVTKIGAQSSLPYLDEVCKFLADNMQNVGEIDEKERRSE
ncbi:MAG: ribokinase [Actinobacteria bacterium]|nr:ribokinase [Actinomycetota bacterium]